jgi:hypothetical protein
MSERLPYEQQLPHQWDALPLPDENLAWADMKRRLEDEDERRPIAWWQRGCLLWGFLLLSLLGIGWWIVRPEKWIGGKKKSTITQTEKTNDTSITSVGKKSADTLYNSRTEKDSSVDHPIAGSPATNDSVGAVKDNRINVVVKKETREKLTTPLVKSPSKKQVKGKNIKYRTRGKIDTRSKDPEPINKTVITKTDVVSKDSVTENSNDSVVLVKKAAPGDSINQVIKNDSLKKKDPKPDTALVKKEFQKDTAKRKLYFWSAGIALHQQLPVAGQQFTPYNKLGRKGSLGDYIPSVYVRLNRKDKWFLQAEFRYGAPQHTKEFLYDQQSVPDTGQSPVFTTITSTSLKKTFYHQLPLTFQYYVAKNWSLGGGIQWNRFSSAVVGQEVNKRRNLIGQDSIVSKLVLGLEGDSAYQFARSFFLGVIETEYSWKRFSIGARYTFGLQPYIKFNLPGAQQQEQKSTSLQIFLRYQLWRSGD